MLALNLSEHNTYIFTMAMVILLINKIYLMFWLCSTPSIQCTVYCIQHLQLKEIVSELISGTIRWNDPVKACDVTRQFTKVIQ